MAQAEESWVEIDVTAKDEDGKKPVIVDRSDKPEDETVEKPVVVKKSEGQEDDPELEGVNTEGAQRRIKKLVAQRKAAEAERNAERAEKDELKQRLSRLEKLAVKGAEADAETYAATIQGQVQLLEDKYKEAFKAGDADAAADAMQKLVDSKMQLADLKGRKKPAVEEADEDKPQARTQTRVEKPAVHPKTQAFIEENADWWGKDEAMTGATAAIAKKLEKEGYSPDDDDYYEEAKARLATAFPHKFQKPGEGRKAVKQTLGGASRGSPPNRVRLSESEQALARRLGLTLEQFGRSKATTADVGYTTIDI